MGRKQGTYNAAGTLAEKHGYRRVSKRDFALWQELDTGMDETIAISMLCNPVVTVAGYPVAIIKNTLPAHPSYDLTKNLTSESVLTPIKPVSEDMIAVCNKHLEAITKALNIPCEGEPVSSRFMFSEVPDDWMEQRIVMGRQTGKPVPALDTVEAILKQITVPDWCMNIGAQVKDRVASTEYINRMWVWCKVQAMMEIEEYASLYMLLDSWMRSHHQFLTAEEMMGAATHWQNARPAENKIPVMSRMDSFPIAYDARDDLHRLLVRAYTEFSEIGFPPRATDYRFIKDKATEDRKKLLKKLMQPREQRKCEDMETVEAMFTPKTGKSRGTISLGDGTKLITIHNSKYQGKLLEGVMKFVEHFFSEERRKLNELM